MIFLNKTGLYVLLLCMMSTAFCDDNNTLVRIKGMSSGKQHSARVMKLLENSISVKSFIDTPYYHLVAPATKMYIPPHPLLSGNPYSTDSRKDGNLDFPAQYLITLPHAKIVGNAGMVITKEGYPFCDYATSGNILLNDNWKLIERERALDAESLEPTTHIKGTVAVITGPEAFAFYHWMIDDLPRLETLRKSGVKWDKLYVNNYHKAYVKRALIACGIREDQIIKGGGSGVISADKVIVPSMPTHIPHARPTWVCDFLRSLFIKDDLPAPIKRRKIYIARKVFALKYDRREVVNENELMQYLSKQGFEKVYLEDHTLKSQAELFNSADVIIAAHGAGLLNLVYCDRNKPVKLIEFFHPEHVNESYWHMTQQLNFERGFHFEHTCLITPTDPLSEADKKVMNIYIPLKVIQEILPKKLFYSRKER